MATPTRIIPKNDWKISETHTADDWLLDQTEPLGALIKRVRYEIPPDTMVVIGFPERVPGTGPSFTQPFRAGDVFIPAPGGNSEPELQFPISQRNLEWWLFLAPPP